MRTYAAALGRTRAALEALDPPPLFVATTRSQIDRIARSERLVRRLAAALEAKDAVALNKAVRELGKPDAVEHRGGARGRARLQPPRREDRAPRGCGPARAAAPRDRPALERCSDRSPLGHDDEAVRRDARGDGLGRGRRRAVGRGSDGDRARAPRRRAARARGGGLLPSATMANQIAAAILTRPGDELIVEETAHMVLYELGGAARHSGLQLRPLRGERGAFSPAQVRRGAPAAGRPAHAADRGSSPSRTRTTAPAARVWPLDRLDARRRDRPRARRSAVHLDGARLAQRRRRARPSPAARDRRAVRHRHALPVERPRLPARRADRRLGRS